MRLTNFLRMSVNHEPVKSQVKNIKDFFVGQNSVSLGSYSSLRNLSCGGKVVPDISTR